MKSKLMLGACAGALILFGGVTISSISERSQGVPFLTPLTIAKNMCGKDEGALSKQRAFFVRAASAYAQEVEADGESHSGLRTPVASIAYAVSSSKPETQAWFNQGLAFTYGFNHQEAIFAFQRAQEIDPECAMCYWGEAFAHGPNINAPMFPDAVEPAYEAIQMALALKDDASPKEAALIDALATRYAKNPPADRSALDAAFADAMDSVAAQYPDDDFIAVLAAEANMDTQPWNYWESDGRTPSGRTARTISLLETVLARSPNNPAAIHLYIHITEATTDPYRAADHADRLAALTPTLGHLVHMPSHTYYRIGRFKTSLEHNLEAVKADEAFLESADASILYEYGYFTHNIHFALTSAQMAGDAKSSLMLAKKLDEKLPIDMAAAAPWVQPIKAAPYFAMAQFASPEEILALEDPGETMPYLQAMWRYARGTALAVSGDHDGAMQEVEAISGLLAEKDFSDLVNGGVPATDVLNIARLTVTARASAAAEDYASAVEAMEEVVHLQANLAYTEPPYWYYPAKQTLASYVLQNGNAERAEQLFLESLTSSPNNAWTLYGLAQAYAAQKDKKGEKFAKNLFKEAWLGDGKDAPSLNRL